MDLGRTFADITICKHSYGFNRTCFEVPTNIADVGVSIFGEFERVNNLGTCLLLHVGGSLYNNRFVLYTIIDIIIRCDSYYYHDHAIVNVKQSLFTYSRCRFSNSANKLPGNFLILFWPKNL